MGSFFLERDEEEEEGKWGFWSLGLKKKMSAGWHNRKFVPPKFSNSLKYMSERWDTQNMCMKGFLKSEKHRGVFKTGIFFTGAKDFLPIHKVPS